MSKLDIIRAWKDKNYRNSLSAEQQSSLPEHPAGEIELTSDELGDVEGGSTWTVGVSIAITLNWCYSFVSGGTCRVGTWGCGSGC